MCWRSHKKAILGLNEKACQNFIKTAKETEKLKDLSTLSKRKKYRKLMNKAFNSIWGVVSKEIQRDKKNY